jgi:hypothetical protein
MARGWESKSVEAQQADAADRKSPGKILTSEQASRLRQLEGLRLSRQHALRQLEAARDPRRRSMLEQSLAELDRRMLALAPLK